MCKIFQESESLARKAFGEEAAETERRLRDNISSLEKSAEERLSKISELESLVRDREELEQKLSSLIDEKKNLLERCLEAEADLQRDKSQADDLRRKLDDSRAALQELGRENQSIQVGNKLLLPK